jgi:hypothetical protein
MVSSSLPAAQLPNVTRPYTGTESDIVITLPEKLDCQKNNMEF